MIKMTLPLFFIVLLAGCEQSKDPIENFISQVESRSNKDIEQLEPETAFNVTQYNATPLREPFSLPAVAVTNDFSIKQDCWQSRWRSKNGALEQYPIEQLYFRGVISSKGNISGLVQTPQGILINVQEGEYVGLNNGKVVEVTPEFILINEALPDGLGCWQQRSVKLALKSNMSTDLLGDN